VLSLLQLPQNTTRVMAAHNLLVFNYDKVVTNPLLETLKYGPR